MGHHSLISTILLTNAFWRERVDLTLTFFLTLALVPIFFPADSEDPSCADGREGTRPPSRERRSRLGLAIVRTLVDHLGGSIDVTSQLSKGTTFTVTIPGEPVASDAAEESRQAATGRVLIVDDHSDVLDAIASFVDEPGFECDRATSAAVAANLLASRAYDAALLDVEMPVKGSAELASETRRGTGPNAHARFNGMSAGEASEEIKRVFDVCLAKPVEHGALRHALLGPGHGARPSQPGLWMDD